MLDVLTKGCNKFKVGYMVQKFRKKPVVIEAIQFNGNDKECISFCKTAEYSDDLIPSLIIPTLEGKMKCSIGDWIIKGVNGEFYPCKPDIFEKTYESADTPQHKTPIVLFDRALLRDDVTDEDIANKITIINK